MASSFQIIALQETRVRTLDELTTLCARFFPNHRLASYFLYDRNGTGSAVLVHTHTSYRTLLSLTENKHRLLSVLIRKPGGPSFTFSSLYAPSTGTHGGAQLKDSLLDAALFYRNALLLGDLNARSVALGCRTTNTNGMTLLRYINNTENVILNDPSQPTFLRVGTGYADCLDWAVATPHTSSHLTCGRGTDVGSDHFPLLVFSSGRGIPVTPSGPPLPRWRTSKIPLDTFTRELNARARDIPNVFPESPADIEDLASKVEEAFQSSADACLTRSKTAAPGNIPKPSAWTRLLTKQKRRIRDRIARGGASATLTRDLRAVEAQLGAQRSLDRARAEKELADILSSGPKHPSFWHTVRKSIRTLRPPPPPLDIPGSRDTASSPQERVEVFADQLSRTFAAVPSDPVHASFHAWVTEETRSHPALRPLQRVSDPRTSTGTTFTPTSPISPEEIKDLISNIHPGKAPGPDGVSSDLIRATPDSVMPILATLFTASLSAGYIPQRWKMAWIRLIPKPGKPASDPTNYRPISLTSYLGKILERIMASRLLQYCDSKSLIPSQQSGFRPGRDTTEQIVLLLQRAGQAANGGMTTAVAALDIAKAFDSVWHDGCLHGCLQDLPVPTCRWLTAFLTGRNAAVIEDGFLSRPFPIKSGVPQGSPLSPLLFSFFLRAAPLPRDPLMGASVYADDITIWAAGPTPAAAWEKVDDSLEDLHDWASKWGLSFSTPKTQAAHLGRRRGGWWPSDISPPSFRGTVLKWDTKIDLLGCRLDAWQTFRSHARRLRQSVRPRVEELKRLLIRYRVLPIRTAVILHQTLIRSRLLYAAPAMATAHSVTWGLLESLERRSLRTACRLPLDAPAHEVYDRARIKPLRTVARGLGGRFLRRHTDRKNNHLLQGFRPISRQKPEIIRMPTTLDILWEAADEGTKRALRLRIPEYPPERQSTGRRSRATRIQEYWNSTPTT